MVQTVRGYGFADRGGGKRVKGKHPKIVYKNIRFAIVRKHWLANFVLKYQLYINIFKAMYYFSLICKFESEM